MDKKYTVKIVETGELFPTMSHEELVSFINVDLDKWQLFSQEGRLFEEVVGMINDEGEYEISCTLP